MTERISPGQARRIALAAQGFGVARPERFDQGHLRRLVKRLGLHQIDSVNVLARAHSFWATGSSHGSTSRLAGRRRDSSSMPCISNQ
jgi:uncharacterized protein YcaQ